MSYLHKEQGDHVMSWRQQWAINNPVRGWIHPPKKIFGRLVEPGMTVVDTGCGTGFFSLHLARMVGESGKVVAVDLQGEALARVKKKAEQAGLGRIVETWKCEADDIGKLPEADFGLSFYMAHETPDIDAYFARMAECIKQDGKLLLVEPWFHVPRKHFETELAAAGRAGFKMEAAPSIKGSHTALLKRP